MSDEKRETIASIKGFNSDMTCRGFQFAEGETYTHAGEAIACESGFHAVSGYPLEVLRYYSPAGSRFFHVEQSGQLARHEEDSKVASTVLKIGAELSLAGLIKLAVEYTTSRCKPIDPKSPAFSDVDNGSATASGDSGAATASGDSGAATASGYSGAATASGYSGAATASGYSGAATASGYSGAATASGYSGAATASGYSGAATASGYSGAATASGYSGAATASGYSGAATASGYSGAATASGYSGAATASGNRGAATASGNRGAATASGDSGAATASGYRGAATAEGKHSVAMASGFEGKARGNDGTALFLVYRDSAPNDDAYGRIMHAKAVIVGQNGTKPMVFYALNSSGEIVEA
ncbi:hypothetical protein NDK50_08175 [Paraburkholderia bryophila]|uniref:DUF7666 domain-containing protein n=1 Tax=Paraburkholderia bryophila TaxID=420952 RepID=UPI00234B3BC1|nr:hypothetical protein [Paraburkholderia bryophila]WCM21413.1 hypothetical protein NDK50_08175 [Paraburkholderia bryophila]